MARVSQLSYSIEQIDAMTPEEFELAVRDLMIRDQITARHVGQRGDQAADVKARTGLAASWSSSANTPASAAVSVPG